jgi:hypothetical protein
VLLRSPGLLSSIFGMQKECVETVKYSVSLMRTDSSHDEIGEFIGNFGDLY